LSRLGYLHYNEIGLLSEYMIISMYHRAKGEIMLQLLLDHAGYLPLTGGDAHDKCQRVEVWDQEEEKEKVLVFLTNNF